MADPFIGEIRLFAGTFAPANWALCDGQLLSISSNQALFAVIGTTYGGNGVSNFQLPDLRGRVALHQGQGPGTSLYQPGEMAGSESVVMSTSQMPIHTHQAVLAGASLDATVNIAVADTGASEPNPGDNILAASQQPGRTPIAVDSYAPPAAATSLLGGVSASVNGNGSVVVSQAGGSLPLSLVQPTLCVTFIIALIGIFPSRG